MTAFVKTANSNEREHRREMAIAINQILLGRTNNTAATVFLAGTTQTVITNPNFGTDTIIFLVALDANGQNVNWYLSNVTQGQITVNHTAPPGDAVFAYAQVG